MGKNAFISLKSFNELDTDEVIEVITPGEFEKIENGFKAIYDETELSGMEGTKTTLKILENELVLEER